MAERGVKSVLEETPSTWRWSTRHHVVGAESRERGWWLTPAASSHQDEGLSTLPAAGGGMPALLGKGRTAGVSEGTDRSSPPGSALSHLTSITCRKSFLPPQQLAFLKTLREAKV